MAANKSRTRPNKSVVPDGSYDHRPSSSMAGRRPSHFFKIILPSTMADKKLRIPEKFVREFGDELLTVATLTLPYGHIWQVGLEKANKKIWFREGWQDFVEYHSLDYGYFLVFRYEGNSNFHLLVFDKTATEIQYPSTKNCKLKDQVDIMVLDDSQKSRHDKLEEKEVFNSDALSIKHEDREMFDRERLSGESSKRKLEISGGREKAIKAARMFNPKSPSFIRILGRYNKYSCFVYVPAKFSINYLSLPQIVKLQTSDGKQWHAKCDYHNQSNSAAARIIGRGWTVFSRDNNLKEGDVCGFELIKRKPIVFNVSIFRVVDYA